MNNYYNQEYASSYDFRHNNMTMTYEFINPEKAEMLLQSNSANRKISRGTVNSYARDIINGNWDESVGVAISIDENGVLRDGQHRLAAIIQANKGIHTWVCRNVSANGIYDNNRKRRASDQIAILKPDLDLVYRSTRYISIARVLINQNFNEKGAWDRSRITPKDVIDFTEKHKDELDGFFLNIPQTSVPKIALAVVHLALFLAYANGVDINIILDFYDILCSGMSTKPEEFPIIAYRNYLKDSQGAIVVKSEVCRCQYALMKYISKDCVKRSIAPKELIYPFPWSKQKT